MENRVTVILTNYNYGAYLGSAVKSVLNQTHKCNLCVIDDGSTDNSWKNLQLQLEKIGELAHKIDEVDLPYYKGPIELMQVGDIVCLRITNSGASTARNVGMHFTDKITDVYGILDADDEYYPSKVEELLKPLSDKNVGVTYGDYIIRRSLGDVIWDKIELKEPYSRETLLKRCIVHSGSLIKKEFLHRVILPNGEFFDSRLHGPLSKGFIGCTEDYDLWLRLSKHCMFIHVPKALSLVRETGQNQSFRMTNEIYAQNSQIFSQR